MNWKIGPVETEGAGPAEILYVTPCGQPLAKHEDGKEVLHYGSGRAPNDCSETRNLKPQRETVAVYWYRAPGNTDTFRFIPMEQSRFEAQGLRYMGSATFVEGEFVPGTEPQE